jgi:hypothetical protein
VASAEEGENVSEHRPGSGGVEDNVRDEMDEASSHGSHGRRDASREAVEAEERTGGARRGSGGVEDNVRDEMDEASSHGSHGRGDASKEAVEAEERTGGARGTGGTESNVRDELDTAAGSSGSDAVVDEPEGVKDAVADELHEAQKRSDDH